MSVTYKHQTSQSLYIDLYIFSSFGPSASNPDKVEDALSNTQRAAKILETWNANIKNAKRGCLGLSFELWQYLETIYDSDFPDDESDSQNGSEDESKIGSEVEDGLKSEEEDGRRWRS
jgi:hypothetical protein